MNVTAETYGHSVILNIKGELTEDTLNAFRQVVDHHLGHKQVLDVVLNLETASFIDSAALEYLLDLRDRLAQNSGRVKLVKPDENVRKILEITRLKTSFEIFNEMPQAVQAAGT